MAEYVNGDVKFTEFNHSYSVYQDGKWKKPPSFSKIKGQLKQGWAIPYGAKHPTIYFLETILPLVISGDLVLTKADLMSEDYNGLMKTAKRKPQDYTDSQQDIGKDAHGACERFVLTETMPIGLSEGANNSFNSFHLWETQHKDRIGKTYFTELPLYSKSLNFCITPDRVFQWDGKLELLDYKTSADLYVEENSMQCAAYIYVIEENIEAGKLEQYGLYPGMKFETGGMLWLNKYTGAIAKYMNYGVWLECALAEFVHLRDLVDIRKDLKSIKGLSY